MSSYPVKFGKYLLLERVNVGGMAEVFKAKTFGVAGFERILAIKRILPNLVEDDEFIRMFIDEARIAVQLNHTNIVQIYELGKHGEHYYIAMEYVPSRDLRAILDRMRSNGQLMPIPQAAYVCKKVCEGLDYAHKKRDPSGNAMNIIHRDVSPQNILLGFEGEVKVIDFGIAKAANRASKTQAGVLKGKFGYMSPEQVRGLPTDRRSDIFAVGVLLYEMLTGERLFIGESDFSTLERVRNAEVIPPTNFNKKISPALEQIVLKTLAREVDDRFQWASELAEELEPFLVEDKQVFNMKRLAATLKETYAAEIALERQKLEEFLRVTPDDAKPEKIPGASSLLPLHPHETDPSLPKPPPHTSPAAAAPQQKITAEEEEEPQDAGFGEDKTFVIEASAAGVALQNQVTEEPAQKPVQSKEGPSKPMARPPSGALKTGSSSGANAAAMPNPKIGAKAETSSSNTSRKQPAKPENTNDDFLEQVSLYGDDAGSGEMDDSRTLVSAPNPLMDNPTGEEDDDEIDASEAAEGEDSAPPAPSPMRGKSPPPPPVAATNPKGRTMTAEELSDAPTSAAMSNGQRPPLPPPAKKEPPPKPKPQPQAQAASKAFDPVAAAMEEEEKMAMQALRGTTGGRHSGGLDSGPTISAPSSSRVNAKAPGDVAGGPQLPAKAFDATQEAAAYNASVPDDDDVLDDHIAAPAPVIVQAIPPQMMKLLIVAAAASLLVFLVIVIAIAVKLSGMRSTTQLVLYTAGEVQAPPDMQVSVDDVTLPSGLSAPITLSKGPHRIRIKGSGIVPMTRVVRANGGSMKQPVLLVALEPEEKAPTPDKGVDKEDGQAAPVVTGGWRLSLAAVADDTGKPVNGADVLINGARYGRTPLEAEVDASLDKVTVRIKKEGFIAREVPIVRNGREHVGPATVRLLAGGAADAAPDEKPTKVAEIEKPVKADKAPPPPPDKAPPPPPVEKKAPVETKAPVEAKVAAAPAEKPKTSGARVHLQIGASPTCDVLVDGRKLASVTPLYNDKAVPLSAGRHRVELVDKSGGKHVKVDVNIASDDPANKLVVKVAQGTILTMGAVTGTVVK